MFNSWYERLAISSRTFVVTLNFLPGKWSFNTRFKVLVTPDSRESICMVINPASVPRGYRVLARLPDLPDNLHDSIVQKYKSLPKLLSAPTEKLYEIEGIGRNRAQQLRDYFDTLLKNVGFSYINGH